MNRLILWCEIWLLYVSFGKRNVLRFKHVNDQCRYNFEEVLIDNRHNIYGCCVCCTVRSYFDYQFCSWNINSNYIYASGNMLSCLLIQLMLKLPYSYMFLWILICSSIFQTKLKIKCQAAKLRCLMWRITS
jgi:hypothetical protein